MQTTLHNSPGILYFYDAYDIYEILMELPPNVIIIVIITSLRISVPPKGRNFGGGKHITTK